MREIKFRGKRQDTGEWVFGDLTRYSENMSYITSDLVANLVYKVDANTVCQYVEKLDAYEKDVLYGEFVQDEEVAGWWYGIVTFDEELGRVVVDLEGNLYEVDDFEHERIEGNIIDTPDLADMYSNYFQVPIRMGGRGHRKIERV